MQKRLIVFSVDNNFVEPFEVMFYSLTNHTRIPDCYDYALLFDRSTLNLANLEKILNIVENFAHKKLQVFDCQDLLPENLKWDPADHVSKATYYRLFCANLFPTDIELATYLDSDMIILDDISDLLNINLSKPIAAVDHYSPADEVRLWGGAGGRYFNAGLIVMNLELIRNGGFTDQYLQALTNERHRILWHDQDVLNIVHKQDWESLDVAYNVTRCALKNLGDENIVPRMKILHFDGWNKPWHPGVYRRYGYLWRHEYNKMRGQPHIASGKWSKLVALSTALMNTARESIRNFIDDASVF